jgi:hypothetical protein
MRHLRLLVVTIFLVLIALTGTAVLHGRALAPESSGHAMQAMGLDACNGRLCFMQLVPGVTTMDDAKQTLRQYIYRDDGGDFHSQIGNLQIRVEGSYGSEISNVQIDTSSGAGSSFSVPLSEIIEQFGTPCYVSTSQYGYGYGYSSGYANGYNQSYAANGPAYSPAVERLSLIYPSFVLEVNTEETGRLSLDSMVSGITLQSGSGGSSNLCEGYSGFGIPWRGFASANVYLAQSQVDQYRDVP